MTFRDDKGTILVVDRKGDKMVSVGKDDISLPLSGELTLSPLVSVLIKGGRTKVIEIC